MSEVNNSQSRSEALLDSGHSVIENTRGAIIDIKNPETKLKVIDGLTEVLKYERLQALKQRPDADPDWLMLVDGSSIDHPAVIK